MRVKEEEREKQKGKVKPVLYFVLFSFAAPGLVLLKRVRCGKEGG